MIKTVVFILLAIPILLYFKDDFKFQAKRPKTEKKPKRITLRKFKNILEGKSKPNIIRQNIEMAKEILIKTKNVNALGKILKSAAILSSVGFILGLLLKNIFLAVSLAGGLYFLPLWAVRFKLYAYEKLVNEELEIALGLITTSYIRGNDLVKAVNENIENINYPIKEPFISFLNNVRFVGESTAAEIEKIKSKIDNKLFWEWCDILILCQDDHTLKHSLIPIINKFSDRKAQQSENETSMLLPLRTVVKMIMVVLVTVPLLYMFDSTWFYSLLGQIFLSITSVVVFWCINAAIELSSPIEYDI